MLSRRNALRFSTLIAGALVLAACAPPPSGSTTPASTAAPAAGATEPAATESAGAAPAASGEAITIVHWQHHSDARAKVVQALAKEFEAANPGIKIDFQSIPYNDFFQKIGPSLEAGTGPDVFQIPGPLVREFYDRDQLASVPESVYLAADIEKDFLPWTVSLLKQGGNYVGLPTDVQPFVVFYNDAMFKEAGLDPSKTLETWDEFTEAAVKLTKRDGDVLTQVGWDSSDVYQMYWAMPMITFDKGWVDSSTLKVTYNNDEGVAMWQWMTDLITKHKVDSPEFLAGQQKFALGKAAMDFHEYVYAGTLAQTAPDLQYSIHLPPHGPGRPATTGGTNWSYVVSKQSKNAEAAWNWVKFLTSAEAQKQWVLGGGELPSRVALYEDAELKAKPQIAQAFEAMQVVKPFNDFGWDDVYAIHQGIWDNVVLKGVDVKTAVADAATAEEKLYADKKLKPSP